jgi:pimeloyl-ACP methyl ester carboxylesterase
MLAVLDALEVDRVQVVGHDWGAAVAWGLAAFAPARVERLVVLSVGHPRALSEPTIEQREKSWYMLLFQFPDVAEALLQRDDWQLLRQWLRDNGDVEDYIADLSRPGVNWYRANMAPARQLQERLGFLPATAPARGVWRKRQLHIEGGCEGRGRHLGWGCGHFVGTIAME